MLEMHFHNADCIKPDIIWTLKSVLGFSIQANNELNGRLSAMFLDSKIANVSLKFYWEFVQKCKD